MNFVSYFPSKIILSSFLKLLVETEL